MQQDKPISMRKGAVTGLLGALGATLGLLLLFALLAPGETQAAGRIITPQQAAAAPVTATTETATTETATTETATTETASVTSVSDLSGTVHIIVQFAERDLAVRAITLTEPISGLEALLRSGLEVTVAETSFGPAVCAVENVGCPATIVFATPHASGAMPVLATKAGSLTRWVQASRSFRPQARLRAGVGVKARTPLSPPRRRWRRPGR